MDIKDRIDLALVERRPGPTFIAVVLAAIFALGFWQGWRWRDGDFSTATLHLEAKVRAAEAERDQALARVLEAERKRAADEDRMARAGDDQLDRAIAAVPAGACIEPTAPINSLITEANR